MDDIWEFMDGVCNPPLNFYEREKFDIFFELFELKTLI